MQNMLELDLFELFVTLEIIYWWMDNGNLYTCYISLIIQNKFLFLQLMLVWVNLVNLVLFCDLVSWFLLWHLLSPSLEYSIDFFSFTIGFNIFALENWNFRKHWNSTSTTIGNEDIIETMVGDLEKLRRLFQRMLLFFC
jgi:hypothetical protein